MLGSLSSLVLFAALTPAISYHGKLVATRGESLNPKVPVVMEFRIHGESMPDGDRFLWGRRVPVKVDSTGNFYLELSDRSGTALKGADKESLADALAATSDIYLGITPQGHSEMLPRKRLGCGNAAALAVCARKAKAVAAKGIRAEDIAVSNLVVEGDLTSDRFVSTGAPCKLKYTDNATIGDPNSRIVFLKGVEFNTSWHWPSRGNWRITSTQPDCIMSYSYSDSTGAFSIPLPGGVRAPSEFDAQWCLIWPMFFGWYNPFF